MTTTTTDNGYELPGDSANNAGESINTNFEEVDKGHKYKRYCGVDVSEAEVVYIDSNGKWGLANASVAASAVAQGFITEDGAANAERYARHFGRITNTAWSFATLGARVFLSATTPGAVTVTEPTAPNKSVPLGVVISTDTIFATVIPPLNNQLSVGEDQDITAIIGRGKLGYDGTNSDEFIASHIDHSASTHVALRQNQDGQTTLNSWNNALQLAYNGDAVIKIDGTDALFEDVDIDLDGTHQVKNATMYRGQEQSSDPSKPAEGNFVIWMSDGTGLGADGDIIVGVTAGGSSKYTIIHVHATATAWP